METNVDPAYLEMEITESVLMENTDKTISVLKKISELGIKIAIDDFGTGYSSLNLIKKLKVDTIKLDRSFISDISINRESADFVSALSELAHRLKVQFVIEGVETKNQHDILKNINCHEFQGYLYSKPVSYHEFEALLDIGYFTIDSIESAKSIKNQREYFRVKLKVPLSAKMTISAIGGKKVKVGYNEIDILDIGPGGLCFESNIHLPDNKDIMLSFITDILQEPIHLDGEIKWKKEITESKYRYGIQFQYSESDRSRIIYILNKYQIKFQK